MDQSTTNTPSISQKSQIDFSSNLSSLQATDNTISVTIDNKTYSVKFDVNSTINDEEMQKLYDFLDTNGKAKYNLVDPKLYTKPSKHRCNANNNSSRDFR